MGLKSFFLLLLQFQYQLLFFFFPYSVESTPHHTIWTDHAALLEFKKRIKSDPLSVLSNWNETVHTCNFHHVQCDRKHHRVVSLSLINVSLSGYISPFIANLTGLRYLQLATNDLSGIIPTEISSLRYLRILRLEGNKLVGTIPDSVGLLPRKEYVILNDNAFSGTIPVSLFSNCSRLSRLDLSDNNFSGSIPMEIGNCPNLSIINLYNNQFTGTLPSSFMNLTYLDLIDIEYNHFSGELPSEIISNLPNIEYIHLSYNDMISQNSDIFFTALENCTILLELELAGMGLGGTLAHSLDHLSVYLVSLYLQDNRFRGPIPASLGRFPDLTVINLTSNLLTGSIPGEIQQLHNLQGLYLSNNSLTGAIPAALGQLKILTELDLSRNKLSGEIPEELGGLVDLLLLSLHNNALSGKIPPAIGKLIQLNKLDLSYNQLNGSIPSDIIGIHELRLFLNLSHNALEGPLPIELSKLEKVQEIDVSSNKLTGSVFAQISSCIELRVVNVSNNSVGGTLPDTLGDLKNLESLDVSMNNISGPVPVSLAKIQTLSFLNLSFNKFQGLIPQGGVFNIVTPDSFLGKEQHLCGVLLEVTCHRKKHWFRSRVFVAVFALVLSVSACLTIICCIIVLGRIHVFLSSRQIEAAAADEPKSIDLVHNFPRITHRELVEATGGFDQQNLIGSGSYGRVFRGVLPDGTVVAVKVLTVQSGNSTKSFNRECQVLKRIRHRNLIRIITACSLPDFKALVLPYMGNGSLDSCLYPHSQFRRLGSGSSDLSLLQRVNICSDVAEGIAYLHHHSPVKVIHCDLKPSNVLLNDDMTALVSDFGIARLVTAAGGNPALVENMGNSTANMLTGSIGYIAPGNVSSE